MHYSSSNTNTPTPTPTHLFMAAITSLLLAIHPCILIMAAGSNTTSHRSRQISTAQQDNGSVELVCYFIVTTRQDYNHKKAERQTDEETCSRAGLESRRRNATYIWSAGEKKPPSSFEPKTSQSGTRSHNTVT